MDDWRRGIMSSGPNLRFNRFLLDRQNQELRRESRRIPLPPKIFAILEYFALHAGRLVTQDELMDAVWGPITVGDAVLRGYIRDLRRVLRDDAAHPRFIETVPRRGFRFLSNVTKETSRSTSKDRPVATSPPSGLIGREESLNELHGGLQVALGGKRRLVLIAGEAGIGKTALLNAFLDQIRATDSILVAAGQSVEQFGPREAYLPVFDALGALCRGPHAQQVLTVLSRRAPTWLAQMPGLLPDNQFQDLQVKVQGANQTRMLGEFCEAMEDLSASQAIVISLEDLQWSDSSTVDLLSVFARRTEVARILLIGSYRPADVVVSAHPLRMAAQELRIHGSCSEILPQYLSKSGVSQYFDHRFPRHRFPDAMIDTISRTTGGNPMFLTAMVNDLVNEGSIAKRHNSWQLEDDPERLKSWSSASLRQLIEAQLSRLPAPEQRILEAAAVVGGDFTTEMVAAALEIDPIEVEEGCEALARRGQVLRSASTGADQGQHDDSQYEFVHDLYRTAAFDRSSQARRRRWCQRIAEKMKTDAGARADEIATELAYYFEHANIPIEAARYCALAGEKAIRRFADVEALGQFRRGIELLKPVPSSSERDNIELRLQVGLAFPLMNKRGYKAGETVAAISRASELNDKLGDGPQSFGALRGLFAILLGRPDYKATLTLCNAMDRIAQRDPDPYTVAEATRLRGLATFFLGRLLESQDALSRSLLAAASAERTSKVTAVIDDLRVSTAAVLALVQWMLGYPDQAQKSSQDAVARAVSLSAPFAIALAHSFRAMVLRYLHDTDGTIKAAESAIAVCDQYGFPLWRTQASLERGWAKTMRSRGTEGLREIRSALALEQLGLGGSVTKLAEACLHVGAINDGLRAVDEALEYVQAHHEGPWEPELHRLKGELILQRAERKSSKRDPDIEQGEQCLHIALQRAREIDAKSFELRAATSLHKLLSRQGKPAEARRIVAEVYDWFSEGFDTPDLVDARRLLGKR